MEPNTNNMLKALLAYVEREAHDYAKKNNGTVDRSKSYPYVPFHPESFLRLVDVANQVCVPRPNGRKRFLDAGCGPGFLVRLASCMWFEAEGLENNPVHVQYGTERGIKIHEGDMLTFDCRDYSIVYSYVPLVRDLWGEFTRRVSREAEVGAVFVSATNWHLPPEGRYEVVYALHQKPPGLLSEEAQMRWGDTASTWGQVIKKVA